jgi:hypothetical protein
LGEDADHSGGDWQTMSKKRVLWVRINWIFHQLHILRNKLILND